MESPSSPFDQAASILFMVDHHQQQQQQQQLERQQKQNRPRHNNNKKSSSKNWSWFRSSAAASSAVSPTTTTTNTSSSPSSCFTGGLSVDYRDCEAPSPASSRPCSPSHSTPSSPRMVTVMMSIQQEQEQQQQQQQLAPFSSSSPAGTDKNRNSASNYNKNNSNSSTINSTTETAIVESLSSASPRRDCSSPMGRETVLGFPSSASSSSSLMEIELESSSHTTGADSNNNNNKDNSFSLLYQKATLENKRMDREILREHQRQQQLKEEQHCLQQQHQQHRYSPSFFPTRSSPARGSGAVPSRVVFQDILGSFGDDSETRPTTPVPLPPSLAVPNSFYEEQQEEEEHHHQLPITWDPLHMREFNPLDDDSGGYLMHAFYRRLNRILSSPKRISKYLTIFFGLLLVVFVTLDILGGDDNDWKEDTKPDDASSNVFFSSSSALSSLDVDFKALSFSVIFFVRDHVRTGIEQIWRAL